MSDSILNHISQLLKQNPEHLTIIEDQIDLEVQLEYFNMSKTIKENEQVSLNELTTNCLTAPDASNSEIKKFLVYLASMDDVEAYRIIEKFYNEVKDDDLKIWCALALKESRMMLESNLLDEKQVLISTGMGGKNGKLRYFIVLISKNGEEFSQTQRKIITNEFDFVLNNQRSEIEKLDFDKSYAKLTSLIPLDVDIKNTINKAVDECNTFGDFIHDNFIVTNVKTLSTTEIDDFLKKASDTDDDEDDDIFEDEATDIDINDLLN